MQCVQIETVYAVTDENVIQTEIFSDWKWVKNYEKNGLVWITVL